jgi:L-alanine-DL-glutamate epimerase-like enolase superfamily enzyme
MQTLLDRLVANETGDFNFSLLTLDDPNASYWRRPLPPSPYSGELANTRWRVRHLYQTLFETALLDLASRRANVSLSQFLGGRWREKIKTDYWMGRVTPDDAARLVKRGMELGFKGVKVKTTLEDPNVERLEAIAEAAPGWHVTVDPNERFYRLEDALPTIRAMDAVGNMAILEDPFPRFHLQDFAALRPKINARVVVHIDPPESLWAVLTSGAAGGLNIDSHTQGIMFWKAAAAAAEFAGLSIWHGSGVDMGICTAAQLHLAASAPNCRLPGDQVGPWIRETHLLTENFKVEDGHIIVPDGPGLGVDVDMNELDRRTKKQFAAAR